MHYKFRYQILTTFMHIRTLFIGARKIAIANQC